ncbi:MAG: alpha-L-fucosidase [Clostridia bacterium]|nr:alpha-L-fucosidase [Clostridia bacterium]
MSVIELPRIPAYHPKAIDCEKWAKLAKSAGCRFAAHTTKHHEGFANWNTAFSEHCVKNATNRTDIVARYLEAFRAEKIEAGLYFSVLDLTAGCGRNSFTSAHRKMVFGELEELLTRYGRIPFLMVDGWSAPWGGPSYELLPFEEVDTFVKSIQPDCLLMNIGCRDGIQGTDIVFYENGAGQEIEDGFCGPGVLCQKLTKTWMWRESDPTDTLKSADWAIAQAQKYCIHAQHIAKPGRRRG